MSSPIARNAKRRVAAGAVTLSLLATPSLALVASATTVVEPNHRSEQSSEALFAISKIGFNTIVIEDPDLPADTEVVESEGVAGSKHVYTMPVFGSDGMPLQREVVVTEPVDRVIRKGTGLEMPVVKEAPKPVVEEKVAAPAGQQQAASRGSDVTYEEAPTYTDVSTSAEYSLDYFLSAGVINWGGYKFTYYSQSVLPGGGLSIPGRHVNAGGYVSDGDGYIVLAGSAPKGTVYPTPFGYSGKIYDRGTSGNHLDVYIR